MKKTVRIAITGIDGTGKTTVIRKLRENFRDHPNKVYAFRAPQFHEDPLLPFGSLSEAIDILSVEADRRRDATLKSIALFLSMTLYGDIEKHVISAYKPSFLFAERQCIADTLAYAQFYLPLLKKTTERKNLAQTISEILGMDQFKSLEGWLKVVAERERSVSLHLDQIIGDMILICQGNPKEIVDRLLRLYNAELPDQIILLSTSPQQLKKRLSEKKATTPNAELHEQEDAMIGLTSALRNSCEYIKLLRPSMILHLLDTENRTVDQTVDEILRMVGASQPAQKENL